MKTWFEPPGLILTLILLGRSSMLQAFIIMTEVNQANTLSAATAENNLVNFRIYGPRLLDPSLLSPFAVQASILMQLLTDRLAYIALADDGADDGTAHPTEPSSKFHNTSLNDSTQSFKPKSTINKETLILTRDP